MNELCYELTISIFNFLIFIHFTNQITLKPSLAQKLKLVFKFSSVKGKIRAPGWTNYAFPNILKCRYHRVCFKPFLLLDNNSKNNLELSFKIESCATEIFNPDMPNNLLFYHLIKH